MNIFTITFVLLFKFYLPTFANIMPEFAPKDDLIIISLAEGPRTALNTPVHKLKGIDPDGDQLTYTLDGDPNQYFRISRVSRTDSNIVLNKELDRESESEFVLEVDLNDGRTKKPSTQDMLIIVSDINDNAPQFENLNDTYQVEEASNVPKRIATFQATDADEGPNADVSYSLKFLDPMDELLFSVTTNEEEEQAELMLISPLDYEKKTKHVVQLVAQDNPIDDNEFSMETIINITIDVIDISDTPPVFLPMTTSIVEIPEDIPLSTQVIQVKAIDGDKGFNSSIEYTLLNEKSKFRIDSSGIIKTSYKFTQDRSSIGTHTIRVKATETGFRNGFPTERVEHKEGTQISTETEVVINITEVWGPPHFRNDTYVGYIPENSPSGYPVLMERSYLAEVFDNDKNGRDLIKLSIEGDGDTFEVLPNEGLAHISFQIVVLNSQRLDYENLREIDFNLIAEDSALNRTKILVSVYIIDQNDNYPEFSQSQYLVQIPENPPIGYVVAKVTAFDKDSGSFGQQGLRFVDLRGLAKQELKLDEITGEISVIAEEVDTPSAFDREKNPEILITVEVRDNNGRGNVNTATVLIQLEDENDNSPKFLQSFYETEVYENVGSISLAIRIQAFDADEPNTNNSQIKFSLISEESLLNDHIDIDYNTGVLFLVKAFDFEEIYRIIPNFPFGNTLAGLKIPVNFTLQAMDLGNPPQVESVPFTIYVLDKNDCAPKFTHNLYQATIREDVNTSVEILRVEAVDEDISETFSTVMYTVISNGLNRFTIDGKTGIVTLADGYALDWDLKSEHSFNVSCVDSMNLKCVEDAVVEISLLDVNNKPPVFDTKTADICELDNIFTVENQTFLFHYVSSVLENTPKDVQILKVSATDLDSSAKLHYRIDYIKVVYFKRGHTIQSKYFEELDKYLQIDQLTGIITTGELAFDYEMVDKLSVEMTVEDTAGEINLPQVANANLLIEIENVLDLKPRFLLSEYRVTVKENVPVGTVVAAVQAVMDEEVGETAEIKYSLEESEDEDITNIPFKIDKRQGVIWVMGQIDREKNKSYNITVKATKTASLWTSAFVFIEIEDENDNWPVFTDSLSDISVEENIPTGTTVAKVQATDADSDSNGKILYTLEEGNSTKQPFTIDPSSGVISVSGHIDHEKQEHYDLVIKAIDSIDSKQQSNMEMAHESRKTLRVHVKDVNDHKPEFYFIESQNRQGTKERPEYLVFENVTENTSILSLGVIDGDQKDTPNSQVTVKLLPTQTQETLKIPFKVVQEDTTNSEGTNVWTLKTNGSLIGFEGKHIVTFEAQDMGTPPNTNTQTVTIQIVSVSSNGSESPFRFGKNIYAATIIEGYQEDAEIIQLAIFSNISEIPGKLKFEMESTNISDTNLFSISPSSGIVTANQKPDPSQHSQPFYNFTVILSWTGGHKQSIHSITANLKIFNVSTTQTILLLSKMKYEESQVRQVSYELSKKLETLLGLLVSVNATKISTTSTICFQISVICPKTDQVLNATEVQQLFTFSEPEISNLFQEFQLIQHARSYITKEPNGILIYFWMLLFATQDDSGLTPEQFYFKDANMLYLYLICILGYIFIFEIIIVLSIIACKACIKNRRRCKNCNDEEIDYIDYRHLVFNGYTEIPEEIRQLFIIYLDNDEDPDFITPTESDC